MIPNTATQLYKNDEILIADDVEGNCVLLKKILDQAGYRVRCANSASIAIRSIKAQKPSLILLDVRMPGMDGYELYRQLMTDQCAQDIPIIFISASVQPNDIPSGCGLRAVDFILKPFNDAEVLARVATHLALYNAKQDLRQKNAKLQAEVMERKKAEEELKASETLFRTIFNESPLGITLADSLTGQTYSANAMYTKITGRTEAEMKNLDWMSMTHPDDLQKDLDNMALMNAGKIPGFAMEKRFLRPDGTFLWVNMTITPISVQDAAHPRHICMIEDITERKLLERYRKMEREILQIFTQQESFPDTLKHFLSILHTQTGFDAVGIRLKDGDDFPYVAQEGLSKDFLRTENSLVQHTSDGGICRDDKGNIYLEGTCGLVLSGNTDPSNPLFTKGGSFWTNDSSLMLDLPPGQDPRHNPHNKCNYNGYASTALVPIRTKDGIVGLIHLNNRHKGRLTLKTVEILEEVASHIGEALTQKKSEEALRISELRYRAFIDASSDLVFMKDESFHYLISNKANSAFLGATEKNVIGHTDFDFLPDDAAKRCRASDQEVMGKKRTVTTEESVGQKTYETIKFLVPLANGCSGIGGIIRDISEQKTASEKVQRERTFFNKLIEAAPEGIVILDTQRKILRVNTEFIKMFGFTPNEAIGHSIDDLIIPPGKQEEAQTLSESLQKGKSFQLETLRRKKDGSLLNVSITGAPIRIAGELEGLFAIYRDISERKQAEKSLEQSEDKFRSFFEFSPLGKSIADIDGTVHVNSAFAEMLGYSVEELESINWRELTHPEDIKKTEDFLEPIVSGKTMKGIIEKRYLHKNGKVLWTRGITALLRNADGTPRFFITSVENITERKRLDDELRETNDYLNKLIDSANAPIIVWDSQFRITRFNHAFENLTGMKAEEIRGKDIGLLFPEDKKEEYRRNIQQTIKRERWSSVEIPIKDRDGATHIVLWSSATILGSDRETVIATIAQGQDITDLKQAEAELNALNAKLEERVLRRTNELQAANMELESFSYSVSHDLRAPLRSISGFSEIFLAEYGERIPEKGREYLERVQHSAVRMGKLIEDLLQLSRLNKHPLSMEMTDLTALATEVANELVAENPQRDVCMNIEQGMKTFVDPHLMQIVLTNLLGNAWKFTSKREHAQISFGTLKDPQHGPAFFVRDNGVGFDNAYKDKLFTAFQRLHSDKDFSGTGIGLATIARIVRRHGGEVWAEGEVDKGATFCFSIPGKTDRY